MDMLKILEIMVMVFCGLALIGFVTGGSKRKYRQIEFERNQDRLDADFKAMHSRNAILAFERNNLLKERNDYFEAVMAENKRIKMMHGTIWEDPNKAMLAFDDKNKRKWYAAGMVPPSFANNINYYNEMKNTFSQRK